MNVFKSKIFGKGGLMGNNRKVSTNSGYSSRKCCPLCGKLASESPRVKGMIECAGKDCNCIFR
jgi:hypothetical protein